MNLNKGTHYQHRYGGIYRLEGIGLSTVDGKTQMVAYTHIFPFEEQLWLRPIEQFTEERFTEMSAVDVWSFIGKTDRAEFQKFVTQNKKTAKGSVNPV